MKMSLDQVGFATISEHRALNASANSPLERCTLIVTEECNLRCIYCNRHSGEHMPLERALATIASWSEHRLKTVMISGGEPTLHPNLPEIVSACIERGIQSVILATNGTMDLETYRHLLKLGVTEFSISLDAGDRKRTNMIANTGFDVWEKIVESISLLSRETRVVVGLVLNKYNEDTIFDDIRFIDSLGPADIKVTPSSHDASSYQKLSEFANAISPRLLARYPFLGYRMGRIRSGNRMKTLQPSDSHRCWLSMDDMSVAGLYHYPCYIYHREGGTPIGAFCGNMTAIRKQRIAWIMNTDTHHDPICSKHCIDVCIDYNNRVNERFSSMNDR